MPGIRTADPPPQRRRASPVMSAAADTLRDVGWIEDDVAAMLADLIVASDDPQIASVQLDPSGPSGWCRLRVGFADGSTAFIGTSR